MLRGRHPLSDACEGFFDFLSRTQLDVASFIWAARARDGKTPRSSCASDETPRASTPVPATFEPELHLERILTEFSREEPCYDLVDWGATLSELDQTEFRSLDAYAEAAVDSYQSVLRLHSPSSVSEWATFARRLGVPNLVIREREHKPERFRRYVRALWSDSTASHVHGCCGLYHLTPQDTQFRSGLPRTYRLRFDTSNDTKPSMFDPVCSVGNLFPNVLDLGLRECGVPLGAAFSTHAFGTSGYHEGGQESVPVPVALGDVLVGEQRHQRASSVFDGICDFDGAHTDPSVTIVAALVAIVHQLGLRVEDGEPVRATIGGSVQISYPVEPGVSDLPLVPSVLGPLFNGFVANNPGIHYPGDQTDSRCFPDHCPVEFEKTTFRWVGLGNFEETPSGPVRSPVSVCTYQVPDGRYVLREGQLRIELGFLQGHELVRFLSTVQFLLDGPLARIDPPLLRHPVLMDVRSRSVSQSLSLDEQCALWRLFSAHETRCMDDIWIVSPIGHPADRVYLEMDPNILGVSGVFTTVGLIPSPVLRVGAGAAHYGLPARVSTRESLRRLSCLSLDLIRPEQRYPRR